MKIPKYIEKALDRRRKAAEEWMSADLEISKFITSHGLEDDIDTEDYGTGVEGLCNPSASSERIRQAILNK